MIGDFAVSKVDGRDLATTEPATVEDEEDLIALIWVGRPVDGEEMANHDPKSQFFGDLPLASLPRGFSTFNIAPGDIPARLIRGADEKNPPCVVQEQGSSRDEWSRSDGRLG